MLANRVRMGSNSGMDLGVGPQELIGGDMEEGFFGEVSSSELITGDALSSQVGMTVGTSTNSGTSWLKFSYMGSVQFVSRLSIRRNLSWNSLDAIDCIYGDRIIKIGEYNYKIRLMRGFNPSLPATHVGRASQGVANHYSEWNRLIVQVSNRARTKNWANPGNIEDDIGFLGGGYSDGALGLSTSNGPSWCQDTGYSENVRIARGATYPSATTHNNRGYGGNNWVWRPVLELVT